MRQVIRHLAHNVGENLEFRIKTFLLRIVLFIGAFAAAALLVFQSGRFFAHRTSSDIGIINSEITSDAEDNEKLSGPFTHGYRVRKGGDFLTLSHDSSLEPIQSKDFGLFVWIRPRETLHEGDNAIFIAKLKTEPYYVTGYSFGIARRAEVDRPALFWSDARGKGGKLLFSDITLAPQQWTLLAVGVFGGKTATVHSAVLGADDEVQESFHGSHIFEEEVFASAENEPLILGALKSGLFRGSLGPFGIIRGPHLQERWERVRQELRESPLEPPSIVSSDEISLFVPDGERDISAFQHDIISSKLKGSKNKKRKRKK